MMRADFLRGLDRFIEGDPPDPGSVDDGFVERTCADCGQTYRQHHEDARVQCERCEAIAMITPEELWERR